jgi:nucleotide-binding universal stress UspA family protein
MAAPSPRILVALDGSAAAEQVLTSAREVAERLDGELVLFQAVPGLAETLTHSHIALDIARRAVEEDRERATTYLERLAGPLRAAGLQVSVLVAEGPPAAAILHHLEGVAMVAMTTHGRSGLRRTLMGSVAEEVIRNSHLPVLVLRPR